MAYCKHTKLLGIETGREFDVLHGGSALAPLSGIYRCEGCGRSIVAHNGTRLPPDDHHRHDDKKPVEWRLIVRSHWS